MKFVAGSIVIVAGLVIAAGSALMGRTDNSAAEQQWGCCLSKSCGETGTQMVGTKSEGCCGSPCARGPCPVSGQGCGADAEPVMISTEAADGKACKAACPAPAQDGDAAY